jgi:uncharacterized protein (TIGR00251 family)
VLEDGTIKIRLVSPPVEGQANEELVNFLAELLGVKPGDVEIVAGLDGRQKLISVINVQTADVDRIIRASASGEDVEDNDG